MGDSIRALCPAHVLEKRGFNMRRRIFLKALGIIGILFVQPFRSTLHPRIIEEYSSDETRIVGSDHCDTSSRALHRAWIVAGRPHPSEPIIGTMAMSHLGEYFNRAFIDPGLIDGALYRKFYREEIVKPIIGRSGTMQLIDEICYYA